MGSYLIHLDGVEEKTSGGGLVALYGKIQKALTSLPQESKNSVTIMIDDVSLMEVATNGATDLVLDFLHYCHTLTSEFVRYVNLCFIFLTCYDSYLLLSLSFLPCVFYVLYTGLSISFTKS